MKYLILIKDTTEKFVGFVVVDNPIFKISSDWFEDEISPTIFDSHEEGVEALKECRKQFPLNFKFKLVPINLK